MADLSLEVSSDGSGCVVIAVAGEVDLATSPQLAQCLLEHQGTNVIVDLSEVTFMDSSGMTVLVQGYNAARKSGHMLRTTGERDMIRRVLEIAGLDGMLHGDTPGA